MGEWGTAFSVVTACYLHLENRNGKMNLVENEFFFPGESRQQAVQVDLKE